MTYNESNVTDTIDQMLTAAGLDGPLDPAQLERLDQFHVGGSEAVDRLVGGLELTPTNTVIDIGCGLGGPTRHIAHHTGARVLGIDITLPYVEAAQMLTERCGLATRATFLHADLFHLEPTTRFDTAITMHVQMNIADKRGWFGEINTHLADNGRLAVWEICRTDQRAVNWPMPWSLTGSDSHLETADGLLDAISAAGFSCDEWVDETTWTNEWFTASFSAGPPTGAALPILLEDGFTRVLNLAAALSDGTLTVMRGRFHTAAGHS